MKKLLMATALVVATVPTAHADQKREWPDGPLKDFLEHLQRPDNAEHPERERTVRSCCEAGDTVQTKFKVEPAGGQYPEDVWYAWLGKEWVRIPPEKPEYAPDGRAYLFMMFLDPDDPSQKPYMAIVCFVRPKGGL